MIGLFKQAQQDLSERESPPNGSNRQFLPILVVRLLFSANIAAIITSRQNRIASLPHVQGNLLADQSPSERCCDQYKKNGRCQFSHSVLIECQAYPALLEVTLNGT